MFRSPHGAKRNAGKTSPKAPTIPDYAALHPGCDAAISYFWTTI